MSASKINPTLRATTRIDSGDPTLVHLSADQVLFRKNGIEFRSAIAIPVWTEMTVDLQAAAGRKIDCNGVVVACSGNRHTGYLIAMVFTGMTPQHQRQLERIAVSA